MIQNERDCCHEHVLNVARQMMTAARTAPKGKGVDVIETALVTGEDLKKLSEKMITMAEELRHGFFLRDAANVLQAECVVIIGTREQAQGLNCGHCGFPTCAGRSEGVPCALNTVDVGIAVGSACAMAADMRQIPGNKLFRPAAHVNELAVVIARLYSLFRSAHLPRIRSLTESLRKKRNKCIPNLSRDMET